MNASKNSNPPAAGEAAHTPTPWRFDAERKEIVRDVRANAALVAFMEPDTFGIREMTRKNGAFIVTACNQHADLQRKAERCEAQERVLKLTEPCLELALDRATWREANLPPNVTELAHSPALKFALENVSRLLSRARGQGGTAVNDAFIFRECSTYGSFFITHRQGATIFADELSFADASGLVDQLNAILAICPNHTLAEVWDFVACAQPA